LNGEVLTFSEEKAIISQGYGILMDQFSDIIDEGNSIDVDNLLSGLETHACEDAFAAHLANAPYAYPPPNATKIYPSSYEYDDALLMSQ
jgi:hypothetical protein